MTNKQPDLDVQLLDIGYPPAPGDQRFLVTVNGAEAGTVSKHRNTRTEKYPWQASVFVGKIPAPEQPEGYVYDDQFLGSWFSRSGKSEALAAVVRGWQGGAA